MHQPIKQLALSWANTPPVRRLATAIFRLRCLTRSARDIDYYYDPQDSVWMCRHGDVHLPIGFHFSRCSPARLIELIERKRSEARDWWLYSYTPQEGDVIFDIGAGDGTDTLLFSRLVGQTGRVISVEGHPRTLRLLRATCRLNRLDNVTIVPMAIMGAPGKVTMTNRDEYLGNRVETTAAPGDDSLTVVPATTVDQLLDDVDADRISLLKMNIEGAELAALDGMTQTIDRVANAVIACHDFLAPVLTTRIRDAVNAFMREHDFRTDIRQTDPRRYVRDHLYCSK